MREGFARVDDALIDRLFQPLADWMNQRLALGPGRAARGAIDLASLAWIIAQLADAADAVQRHDIRACLFLGCAVVLGLWAFSILRGVFRRADGGAGAPATAQANPLRPGMQVHRVVCLAWMLALIVKTIATPSANGSLALLAVGVFATAAVYIGACTNNPPMRRETRAPASGRDPVLASH